MSCIVRLLCVLLLVAASPQVALAADRARINALVKEVQRVYAAMDSFQATFKQKLNHQESNSFEMLDGELLFKKPLFVRWETAKPYAELLLINNREIWNYLPDEKLAYRYAPEAAQGSHTLIRVVTGQARLDQDFSVEEVGKEDGLLRLRLHPLEPTQQMVEAGIWVDLETHLIKKAVSIDFFCFCYEVAFTRLNTKVKLEEKNFAFMPPKGVTVQDRRKGNAR
jgi:outer membrane lipoprotein carrier protein